MDPNNPQRAVSTGDRSLGNVQKWVMSVLAVTTIVHMQVGLILGAMAIGEGHTDAQVGLMVIATIFGMLAVATGMAIHQRSEETTSELQSLMRNSYAVFWLKTQK